LKNIPQLLKMLESEIKFNKFNLVVIDNLMSILSVNASEKYEQQADFMQSLCDLAKGYNIHIILVLHPNKTYKKGANMEFEQISGTSDLYNKADNVITVMKYDEDSVEINQGINGRITILKNRDFPNLASVPIKYHEETEMLLEIDKNNNIIGYTFNWNPQTPKDFQLEVDESCPF